MSKEKNGKRIPVFAVLLPIVLALTAGLVYLTWEAEPEPVDYPVYGFANMRGEDGIVYKGIGGVYGQELPVEASTFTVREDKLYFAGQIKEDYVISQERTGTLCVANLDGSDVQVLVEDAYNLGFGQEKLIGDKLFYPTGYDEAYNLIYGYLDLNTREKGYIDTGRINNILGYDGTYLYYGGYNAQKSENIAGRYHLKKKRDKILFSYPDAEEVGGISNLHYDSGKIYALTKMKEEVNYDARTAVYSLIVRNAKNGKVLEELPYEFTGAANYGFLFCKRDVYFSAAENIYHLSLDRTEGEEASLTPLAVLKENEYWGIPHFVPGDGYLYYEAIADLNEETGMNDYFYRVKLAGGEPELLAAWFIS